MTNSISITVGVTKWPHDGQCQSQPHDSLT